MMTTTVAPEVPPITRAEARRLAGTENQRVVDLLRSLDDADWAQPTDCTAWDVRALAGHLLGGMEAFSSPKEFVHVLRAASKAAGDGPMVDGMTSVQVQERAGLDRAELLRRLAVAAPKQAAARSRVPGPLRLLPMKEEVGGVKETWRVGYLLDVILTRDAWMHRVDVSRATGRELVLTADHDGRIVGAVTRTFV